MDLFGDAAQRDPVSPFVELLWERGNSFEREVIESLDQPFTNLKPLPAAEKECRTAEAMERGERLIYGGRVAVGNLVGEPDIIRLENGDYVAGDIKSGAGEEGTGEDSDKKPKKHYAVQLALYTDILERLGRSRARRPFVWDVHRDEVVYDLEAPQGPRTPQSLWDFYQEQLDTARRIVSGEQKTLPALSSQCKLCHWHTACTRVLTEAQDLTLIPFLGRSKRDALISSVPTVRQLAVADLSAIGKVPGIGEKMLRRFQDLARLQCEPGAKPFLTENVAFPSAEVELFFDVETDPMRDVCYLHGFMERVGGPGGREKYVSFYADQATPEAERKAFAEAFAYVVASRPCSIYYYSRYERTTWRKLQKKYPEAASADDIEQVFGADTTIDLYDDVVMSKSEWPTRDYSIKTLASHLGFTWRDPTPSGTASIEWYHQWLATGDTAVRQRILEYNEDDCRAMRVLLDGLKVLPVRK
jgi:uncharacterized protein